MKKQEFLAELYERLQSLPQAEREQSLSYYSEMIDDRIDDGMTEEQAVQSVGAPKQIAEEIIKETPWITLLKERVKPKRKIFVWEIVLLVLGAPIWLSLLVSAFAVALSLYVVALSLIIALWAVEIALCAGGVLGVVLALVSIFQGNIYVGVAYLGAGFVCAGLGVVSYFACQALSRGFIVGTKNMFVGRKKKLIGKGEGQ